MHRKGKPISPKACAIIKLFAFKINFKKTENNYLIFTYMFGEYKCAFSDNWSILLNKLRRRLTQIFLQNLFFLPLSPTQPVQP